MTADELKISYGIKEILTDIRDNLAALHPCRPTQATTTQGDDDSWQLDRAAVAS